MLKSPLLELPHVLDFKEPTKPLLEKLLKLTTQSGSFSQGQSLACLKVLGTAA